MAEWDGDDALRRYFQLLQDRPRLLDNPPGKTYQILTDPEAMRLAAEEARETRLKRGEPVSDIRVGVLAEDIYVTVLRDAVRFPDGSHGLYYRLLLGTGMVMLPVLDGDLVLLNAFRHGTRQWHIEAPRGMIDGNAPMLDQARRELMEEMGAEALEFHDLGLLYPSPGVVDECLRLFVVRIASYGAVDEHEAIAGLERMSIETFERRTAAGDITDGPTLAVYLRAKLRGLV